MLTKVEVRTADGDLLTLNLDASDTGLIVRDIQGLDPVKATIVSTSFARVDGSQYQASKREDRNIKFSLGLEPDYVDVVDVRQMRKELYGWFMPEHPVSMRFFMLDGLTVEIQGRVESCEANMFTQDPQVDISILCGDPDFYELSPVVDAGTTTSGSTENPVQYDGSIEAGAVFTLSVNRTINEFTIYHHLPNGDLRQLDFAAPLVAGDVLEISTVSGAKGATLTRSGVKTSVLYAISPQSNWLELQNGLNNIRWYATGAAIPYTITYTPKYGGL